MLLASNVRLVLILLFFDLFCRLGKGKILYGVVKLSTHKVKYMQSVYAL